MIEAMLMQMVGCDTSRQIWKTLEVFFASQTKVKISQFKTRFHNTKKDDLSVNDYLLKIKSLIAQLAFVGYVVTTKDHIYAIFDGLSFEYDTFVVTVNSRNDLYTVAEIVSLLLAQENKMEKHSKELDLANQVNMVKISNNQQSHKKFNGGQSSFQRNFNGQGNYRSQNFNRMQLHKCLPRWLLWWLILML